MMRAFGRAFKQQNDLTGMTEKMCGVVANEAEGSPERRKGERIMANYYSFHTIRSN